MKKLFTTLLGLLVLSANYAQNSRQNYDVSDKSMIMFNTDVVTQQDMDRMNKERHDFLTRKNPGWDDQRNQFEAQLQQWIANNPNANSKDANAVITVPVCVHVVYNLVSQNITDNQVKSQIQVLNEDFGRTNSDANQTPAAWTGIAANTGVQFCLAQRDPSGNPSTGIERRQTTVVSFAADDKAKSFAQGGLDIWDATKYMNIWVVWFGGSGLLGYGEFPTATVSTTFGVVIDYEVFGSNYTTFGNFPLFANYDRGRTTTHEFSHCFNLYHIWGDDGTACTGSDLCADTPNQGGATSGCFTYPHTDPCSPSNPGIMYMNYMDYSYDGCKNLFTTNQKTRINGVLTTTPYNSLATSNGCTPVNLVSNDAGLIMITTPNGTYCSGTFTPVVTIKNWGTNALTSCIINYKIDNNAPVTQNWNGNLASLATTSVTLGSMTTTAGAHTFTAYTTMPNNVADGNPANDQTISNFTIYTIGANLPLVEGFESSTTIPVAWSLVNPNNDAAWEVNTTVARTGVHCMDFNNCSGDGNTDMTGDKDWVHTQPLNFSNVTSASMSFDVAYANAVYQTTTYNDTLAVLVSTDCGATWTQVYRKGGATLATAPTYTITTNPCWPNPTAGQWRNEVINLPASVNLQPNVIVSFENISDWGEQIYIDNINIYSNTTTGVNSSTASNDIHVYPNPTEGTLYVDTHFGKSENMKVFIYNIVGEEMGSAVVNNTMGGTTTLDLSGKANGVYFVRVSTDSETYTQKVVLNR